MAFTPSQQRRLDRRTTPTSRSRLADKLRGANQPAGAKPGLGAGPPKKKPPRTSAPAAKPVGRSSQPDSAYYDKVDLAAREGESRLGQLEGQEQAVKHDFGIEDPTNPFSRAEGLKRMFLQRFRGRSAGIAAQGHLYSGQHERALARTRRDEEEARAGLRSSYDQAIGQIGAAKAGVKFETEEQRQQAFEDWLARAPESEAPAAAEGTGELTPGGASVNEQNFTGLKAPTGTGTQQAQQIIEGLRDAVIQGNKLGKGKPAKGKVKPRDAAPQRRPAPRRARRG
jgi:hypothetical protein